MTNLNMKSKEVSPATIASRRSSMPTSYKQKTSVHPQWMRTLEERYQKLHLKITRNASIMNSMKNPPGSRNYYDSKPNVYNKIRADKVIQKYKTEYGVKNSSTFKSLGYSSAKLQATEISEPVTIIRKDLEGHESENRSRNSLNLEDKNSDVTERVKNENIIPTEGDKIGISTDKDITLRRLNYSSEKSRPTDEQIQTRPGVAISYKPKIKNVHVLQPDNSQNKLYKKDLTLKRENTCKTITSRYSNNTLKTTKSCPANMEKSAKEYPSRLYPRQCISACAHSPTRYPTRKRIKSFLGMSMEAQHAMTETIKAVEPEVAREKDNSLPGDFEHTKDFSVASEVEDQTENGNGNSKWENVDFDINDTCNDEIYSDSELSITTRTRPHTSKTQRTRLPEITPDQRPFESLSNFRLEHFRYRIPGIGNYDIPVFKENTFEITPPGFDIRYKDIPVYEEFESETPPADIKDKAVQKCQEWLSRFTPR